MPRGPTPPRAIRKALFAATAAALVLTVGFQEGRSATQPECERGVLDAGRGGMDVLVYEMCAERLSVGFRNSDVLEEITCKPDGDIELWLSTDDARCQGWREDGQDRVHELWERLHDAGRQTTEPVRKLLTCHGPSMYRTTLVVPDARAALLETRIGDSKYETLTRRFISRCLPAAV